MGNSPSSILFRLRDKGHITEEEYTKLKEAVTLAREDSEPTIFIPVCGGYDHKLFCKKCGYQTTRYELKDAKHCPMCGKIINKERT